MLPAIDEAEGVAEIIPRIPHSELEKMGWDVSIMVVDGGSSDDTVNISKALGAEVIRQQGTGKGAAMRLGFLHFLKSKSDSLVMLDCDGTYHPEQIIDFVKLLQHGEIVVGDRLKGTIDDGAMTQLNYLGNHLLTWFATALFGTRTHDLCSGFWAFNRDSLSKLKLNSMKFEIEAEMFTSCAVEGIEISFVPIKYSKRIGEAKLGSVPDGWIILRKLLVRKIFPTPVEQRLGEGNLAIKN
jgi:glycosyltransferase involved in cell wall biosynthesis